MAITFANAVAAYVSGVLSRAEAVCMLAVAAESVSEDVFLQSLPLELVEPLREYVKKYTPGKMVVLFGGEELPEATLRRLRSWLKTDNDGRVV